MAMTKSSLKSYLEKLARRHTRWEALESTMRGVTLFFIGLLIVWGVAYFLADQGVASMVR